ncbi:dual specificity protein phosphatase family protein [Burkholderia ubonensis]|uniref:dual specificity protein phosphatase family protein n=1 Tax=Burkholderia ubonensis TaxID=101571 RepID=UPI000756C553|nr:dual specificity protein phosphatase family protein [Burkholderia ubonensis]KVP17402.1 hypothetical protein WJ84_03995 [Burkholderia ubonensis]
MITAVDFISLDTFSALAPAADMVAVSIGDPAQMPPANLVAFPASLRIEFLDIEPAEVDVHGFPDEVLCSREQMAELVEFVRAQHAKQQRYRLVVHCRMGSSRSAAAALVVHKLTGCEFPRWPDAHYANRHVVHLAEQALQAPIEIPRKLEGAEPHPYLPLRLQV